MTGQHPKDALAGTVGSLSGGWVEERWHPKEAFSVRSMNFGQHWRGTDVKPFEGTVILPLSFVLERSEEFLRELREDALLDPDPEDELEEWLRNAGWPETTEVIGDRTAFPLLIDYLGFQILCDWFGDRVSSLEPGFVLNSIDGVHAEDESVTFRCTGRLAGTSSAYQD